MESLRENKPLLWSIVLSGMAILGLLSGTSPEFNEQFGLVDIPVEVTIKPDLNFAAKLLSSTWSPYHICNIRLLFFIHFYFFQPLYLHRLFVRITPRFLHLHFRSPVLKSPVPLSPRLVFWELYAYCCRYLLLETIVWCPLHRLVWLMSLYP